MWSALLLGKWQGGSGCTREDRSGKAKALKSINEFSITTMPCQTERDDYSAAPQRRI